MVVQFPFRVRFNWDVKTKCILWKILTIFINICLDECILKREQKDRKIRKSAESWKTVNYWKGIKVEREREGQCKASGIDIKRSKSLSKPFSKLLHAINPWRGFLFTDLLSLHLNLIIHTQNFSLNVSHSYYVSLITSNICKITVYKKHKLENKTKTSKHVQ